MNGNLIRKLHTYISKNSIRSLPRAVVNYFNFSQWPIFRSIISSKYKDLVIDSNELKSVYSSLYWELDENLDGLNPGLNEEIAPLQDNQSLEFNYWPKFSFKQPFVAEVPDVTVAGPNAVAITNNGRCLLDPINSVTHTPNRRLGGAIKRAISQSPINVGKSLLQKKAPDSKETVSVAAIVHPYWNNYYHWTLEELLKLRGIAHYERMTGRDVTLIIPSDPPSYVTESLELLGYNKNDYIEWDRKILAVDRLVVPSFPDLTPKTVEWLRNEITKEIELPDSETTPDWVYISRQNADTRRVLNYSEVESVLEKYGVQPINCEDLSLEEEIRLFSTVDGVIGPHGAGLTGAVWSSDLHLLEIFNNTIKAPYYMLSYILRHTYTALSADPVGKANDERNRDMVVNTDKLKEELKRSLD